MFMIRITGNVQMQLAEQKYGRDTTGDGGRRVKIVLRQLSVIWKRQLNIKVWSSEKSGFEDLSLGVGIYSYRSG